MRTSTQKPDDVQPATLTEATRLENHEHMKDPTVLESSRRASEIVTAAGKNLPNLVEMTHDLDNINDQIHYWTKVREDARSEVNGFSAKLRNAETVLLETKDGKTSQDRSDRDRAEQTIEILTPKLQLQERRVENAATQLRVWKQRLSTFDRARFAKLKKEDARRDDLVRSPSINGGPWNGSVGL